MSFRGFIDAAYAMLAQEFRSLGVHLHDLPDMIDGIFTPKTREQKEIEQGRQNEQGMASLMAAAGITRAPRARRPSAA
jgi:hypothetical protein